MDSYDERIINNSNNFTRIDEIGIIFSSVKTRADARWWAQNNGKF